MWKVRCDGRHCRLFWKPCFAAILSICFPLFLKLDCVVMPVREACHVAVQMNYPRKQKLWKYTQTRHNSDQEKCHYSYTGCGLGSTGTVRLLELIQEMQHSKSSKSDDGTLYGAKITGGGSGGTVGIMGKNCLRSNKQMVEGCHRKICRRSSCLKALHQGLESLDT